MVIIKYESYIDCNGFYHFAELLNDICVFYTVTSNFAAINGMIEDANDANKTLFVASEAGCKNPAMCYNTITAAVKNGNARLDFDFEYGVDSENPFAEDVGSKTEFTEEECRSGYSAVSNFMSSKALRNYRAIDPLSLYYSNGLFYLRGAIHSPGIKTIEEVCRILEALSGD